LPGDNAAFHKRSDSLESIEKHRHTVLFLPPYNPDLNPIEKSGRKQKASEKNTDVISRILLYGKSIVS